MAIQRNLLCASALAFALGACASNPYDKPHAYYTLGDEQLTRQEVARQNAVLAHCVQVVKETTPSQSELALNRGLEDLGVGLVGGTLGELGSLAVQGAPLTAANIATGGLWAGPVYGLAGVVNGINEGEYVAYAKTDYCNILDKEGIHSWAPSEALRAPAALQLAPQPAPAPAAPAVTPMYAPSEMPMMQPQVQRRLLFPPAPPPPPGN